MKVWNMRKAMNNQFDYYIGLINNRLEQIVTNFLNFKRSTRIDIIFNKGWWGNDYGL